MPPVLLAMLKGVYAGLYPSVSRRCTDKDHNVLGPAKTFQRCFHIERTRQVSYSKILLLEFLVGPKFVLKESKVFKNIYISEPYLLGYSVCQPQCL